MAQDKIKADRSATLLDQMAMAALTGADDEQRHDPKAGHADSFVHPAEQDRIVEVVFDFEIANLDLRIRRPGLVKK